MVIDAWLPRGFLFPNGAKAQGAVSEGADWQIMDIGGDKRALIVRSDLVQKWIESKLVSADAFAPFDFGETRYWILTSPLDQNLSPIEGSKSPNSKADALLFAHALKATREIDNDSPLQDAIYVERIGRLLPTYSISPRLSDDVVLGYWLTGGASISAKSFRRLRQTLSWL